MTLDQQIDVFLAAGPFAVVGASRDRSKYGNKVLRYYMQNNLTAYPVNPHAAEVEGLACYPNLASLPEPARSISVITPPAITEDIVRQAVDAGVQHIWMQPGAESASAIELGTQNGMSVISGGPCILVKLGYREGDLES